MRYLSVCAGIEAATVAWHHMGWEAAGYSEIEKFPSQVLDHHYPNIPKLGDMTKYKEWNIGTIDLLVGGTPCQSFSVAGLRKGMADPRGNLALVYCGILDHFRPQWFVWENVPGVLSSNGGRDFGSFLGALAELGYGFAYRVLDAQWFGVAQRRRRVFVVGYLGDWRRAAAVLFERQSLRRDIAPSRETRKKTSSNATQCAESCDSTASRLNCDLIVPSGFRESSFHNYKEGNVAGTLKANGGCLGGGSETFLTDIAPCLTAKYQRNEPDSEVFLPVSIAENIIGRKPQNGGNGDGFTVGGPMYTLNATGVHGVAQPMSFSGQMSNPQVDFDISGTLGAKNPTAVAQPMPINTMVALRHEALGERTGFGVGEPGDPAYTMTKAHSHAVYHNMAVRRLTPTECERLQGFPDGYTDIQPNGKQTPDGPRYKALGNSMAVPVMRWIGERINNAP